jgi:hypothetical protein
MLAHIIHFWENYYLIYKPKEQIDELFAKRLNLENF